MRTVRTHIIVAAILLAALALTPGPASARTWYVKPDSTGDVPTISVAVDSAAAQGDTVLLADGVFEGAGNREVDCLDKAVTIISESGDPEACIIDGGGWSFVPKTAFYFRESPYGPARLEGVTITGFCQGILCDTASCPVIANCVFLDNVCLRAEIGPSGGGIYCMPGSRPMIDECAFRDNSAMVGGGIYGDEAWLTVTNTTFAENGADVGSGIGGDGTLVLADCSFEENRGGGAPMNERLGGGMSWRGTAELTDCIFRDNKCFMGPGGAVHYESRSESDHLIVTGCTFDGNCASDGDGAALAVFSYSGPVQGAVVISRSTFAGNGPCAYAYGGSALCLATSGPVTIENSIVAYGTGGGVFCPLSQTPSLTCCNLYGNVGGDWTGQVEGQLGTSGNISADPLFCDTLSGDFRLETCSPCLPGNHPDGYDCGAPIGTFCSGCACGETTQPTTWGAIKAMYR